MQRRPVLFRICALSFRQRRNSKRLLLAAAMSDSSILERGFSSFEQPLLVHHRQSDLTPLAFISLSYVAVLD